MEESPALVTITVRVDGTVKIEARLEDDKTGMDPELGKRACAMAFLTGMIHCVGPCDEWLKKQNQELHTLYRGPAMEVWRQAAIRNALQLWFTPAVTDVLQQYFNLPPGEAKQPKTVIRKTHNGEDTGYRAN